MSEIAADLVQAARRRFIGRGELPGEDISQPILRSWLRCAEFGLDETKPPPVEPLDRTEMQSLCQRHERLRRLCRSELEALNGEAHETRGIVVLATADGTVLDTLGDAAFAGRAAEVALRPGVGWNEGSTGTNAIGTALAERRPVAVHGAEHFFESHKILSCAAAPIVDPRGVVIGVLNFSAHAQIQHLHALGMIRLAVEQIEHRFFAGGFEDCHILRFHPDAAVLGAAREGILVFDARDRLIAANRRGLSLIRQDWNALDAVGFETLFDGKLQPSMRPTTLRATDGGHFHGSVTIGVRSGGVRSGDAPWRLDAETGTQTLHDVELSVMREALDAAGGNVSLAARRLGIHRATFYRRLLDASHSRDPA